MSATPISDSEYAARIDRVRARLVERGLDGLIAYGAHRDYHPADLRYLARWYCVEEEQAALFIPASGPTTLLTDAIWDLERAQAEAFADDMRYARDMGRALADIVSAADGQVTTVGIAGFPVFPAPTYLPCVSASRRRRSATPPI